MTDVNAIPMLYGQIASGDPKNIWQVAKSGLLEAKENNPYQFNIAVSGRGVNKMHIKVRFFDANMKELGISYVVAPTESVNFDAVNFFGEYISPFGSKYMRIDILSYQMPEQRTYWWIHDMKLFDLEEYKAPNEFTMKKKFDTDTKAHVYARVLRSKVGGNLKISFPKDKSIINTKDISLNQFIWIDLGIHFFEKGENNIAVENVSGFNAVNVFAIIPEDDFERISFPIKKAVERSNIFVSLEAENDFSYSGNLQSERAYPTLSFGKGISSQSGTLSRDIEVLKDGTYSLSLNLNGYPLNSGRFLVDITNKDTGEKITRVIESSSFKLKTEKPATMIDYNPLSKGYPYTIDKLADTLQYYYRVDLKNMFFSSGYYTIKLTFDSKVPSVSTFSDFHKFDVSEVKLPPFIADIFQEDCSDCDRVTKDMMNNTISNGVMKIDYEKTCSCDWYVYASKKIKVNPKEEYLVNVEARSENIKKRHMKVIFLDDDMNVVDVTYINEVEEKDNYKWNKYEQIIKVPEKATLMQYHILARGEKLSNGYLELKNFSIIPYNHMLLVDNVIFYEGNDLDNFFNLSETKVEEVNYEKVDRMKRKFNVSNPVKERILLNYCESPNPVWQIDFGEKQRGTMILNGVTTGFIVNESGEGTTKVILRELYYLGLIVFFLGFVATFVIYEFYTTENRDNNLKKLAARIIATTKNITYDTFKVIKTVIEKVNITRFKRNRR
jgi:thiol-disulfide isomerase/thioredoxin